MDKYERLLRRMLVLTDYGFAAEFGTLEKCEEWLSTNEKLEEYYGKGSLDGGVEELLDAIDLIASAA